jgi:hypothetical protein
MAEPIMLTGPILITPKYSNWKCHMFGSSPGGNGMVYYPSEGNVPNRFVRWMMKVCFACTWVYTEPTTSEESFDA